MSIDDGRTPAPGPCAFTLVCFLTCCLAPLAAAAAAPPGDAQDPIAPADMSLPADVQLRLAKTFAPGLVFHPLEEYFPVSPLFTVEDGARVTNFDDPTLLARLGTAESRRDHYRGLSLDEKAALATVYYRAFPTRHDGKDRIVVEYWFYYVQNDYRIRPNVFPFWVDGSHPNDLEHIHVVLRPGTGADYVLDEVFASSHEGTMPANRYRYQGADVQKRGRYLVERGSHALAPDIDEDGVFTPGNDGDSGEKFLWGIRDRGLIWPRYKRSYMDDRKNDSPRRFEYADAPAAPGTLTYRLVPVEELTRAFTRLDLSRQERKAIFEADKFWFRRVFGSDNGSSTKLLVPPAREASSPSIGIGKFASTERGFLLGVTVKSDRQGALFGYRYSFLHGIRFLPDVVFEADTKVNTLRQAYVSGEALLSYPIDGTTRVYFGRALVTDLKDLGRRQWDWVGGFEFRLGRMRLSGESRSWGPVTQSSKEFSFSHLF
jgi:hypothetical protein